MKLLKIGLALLVSSFILAGCGAKLHNTAQTRQAKTQAETIAKQCLNKGGGWKAEIHCAIPPHHGVAFLRCVLAGVPKNIHNQAADEADLLACGERYR